MIFEIKKILNRNEFWIVALLLIIASCADFVYECYLFKNVKLSDVISAYDGTVLSNLCNTPFSIVFGLLLPILCSFIASSIAIEENEKGISDYIYTRTSRKNQIIKQGAAIWIIVFILVSGILFLNLLMSFVVFPVQGYNSMFQADYEKLTMADKDYMFDVLYRLHPYANVAVFIILRGMFAGCFAWAAYGISYIIKLKNKIVVLVSPFILLISIQMIMRIIRMIFDNKEIQLWFNTNILGLNGYGRVTMLFAVMIVYFIIGMSGILYGRQWEKIA